MLIIIFSPCLCGPVVKRYSGFVFAGLLAAASIALLYGCAPKTQAQYKALSFFFDGVPDPDKVAAAAAAAEKKAGGSSSAIKKVAYTEHGPFAAKECQGCHERGTNRLLAPVDKLCFRCHEINVEKGWTHGPVASGGCRVCHNPHSSGFPFLLMAKPSEFCYYCHEQKDVLRAEVHKGMTLECTTCHDAHSADNRFLVKKQVPSEKEEGPHETPSPEALPTGEAGLPTGQADPPLKGEEVIIDTK